MSARPFSVCVFCGSRSGASPAFETVAAAFGRAVAERGWRLVYGGGEVGLMGVVARAALAAGGAVLGVIPEHLLQREVVKHDLTELVVTSTMFDRKRRMLAESDAFAALPGGLGTLDELLEVMTLKQLGLLEAPILLVDVEGFWAPFQATIEAVTAARFAEPSALALATRREGVAAAMEKLGKVAAGR